MFNTIQIYGKELFNDENIFFTLLIGLLILFFIHKLFFDKNQAIAPPEDIKQCLQRFNSSKIYEYPNLLSDAECDKIIELSIPSDILKHISVNLYGNQISLFIEMTKALKAESIINNFIFNE